MARDRGTTTKTGDFFRQRSQQVRPSTKTTKATKLPFSPTAEVAFKPKPKQ